jgi:hypothetical protein
MTTENTIEISLKLSVNEVNTILKCLGKHPFEEVVTLIQKVKQQGDSQLAEVQQQG